MTAYSFKKQFVWPILIGIGAAVPDSFGSPGPKRQTIRAIGKRRHARPGEVIQLYTAMRTKQCRKLGDAICKSVEPIRISVDGNQVVLKERGRILDGGALDEFARSDGFAGWAEMKKFWQDEHGAMVRLGPWSGVLIQWGAN